MENNQSVNHEPIQLIEPKPTKRKLGSKCRSRVLIPLLVQHPLLFLSGVFTIIVGTSALAFYSLSHVGDAEQAQAELIPVIVEAPITTERSNPIPLWMVMAIALSCSSGCYVIFRLFNRSTQPHKISRRIHRHQNVLKALPQATWKAQTQNLPVFPKMQSLPGKTKSLVTVLPAAHQYHFDKGKESLAELMDIRKDHSLSALLQK